MRALQQQRRQLAVKVERERGALATLQNLDIGILDYFKGSTMRHDTRYRAKIRCDPGHPKSHVYLTC